MIQQSFPFIHQTKTEPEADSMFERMKTTDYMVVDHDGEEDLISSNSKNKPGE